MTDPAAADAVLEAHISLRLDALGEWAPLRATERGRVSMFERLAPLHRDGTVMSADDGQRVRAVLAWRYDPEPWCGVPICNVTLDYDPSWPGAPAWIRGALDAELPRMEVDLDLAVYPGYAHAYRALLERGLGVSSVALWGDPAVALARLIEDRDVPRTLAPIVVAPLAPEQLDDVIELGRAAFVAEPQYCWFYANEKFLSMRREELERDIARPDHVQRVLMVEGRVVGHLSASVERESPLFGPIAGMSVILDPSLRGRGLLRPIYRMLLEDAIASGARMLRGSTSQAPVMKLARTMERGLVAVMMRRDATLPESHFAPYVPL